MLAKPLILVLMGAKAVVEILGLVLREVVTALL